MKLKDVQKIFNHIIENGGTVDINISKSGVEVVIFYSNFSLCNVVGAGKTFDEAMIDALNTIGRDAALFNKKLTDSAEKIENMQREIVDLKNQLKEVKNEQK